MVEAGSQKEWVVRSFLKADLDLLLRDRYVGGGVDQIAKDVPSVPEFPNSLQTVGPQVYMRTRLPSSGLNSPTFCVSV